MISRRQLGSGMGVLAAGALLPGKLAAQAASPAVGASRPPLVGTGLIPNPTPGTPPAGPWTQSGVVRRGGGQLYWAKVGPAGGNKPPVVLLHKLGGWMADWRHVAAIIGKDRQIIAIDLPGHGGSRFDGAPPYLQTLGETAALLVGMFDELGMGQIDLVGTSLGGCVAASLAAFYPERIHRLAIVSSALTRARSLATIADVVDKGQTALFDANGLPLPTEPALLKRTFGIVNGEAMNPEGIASRQAAGRWIQPSERGVAITDIVANLARVEAQTLLLYGQFDPSYVRFRVAAETALRRSRTEYVPNAGAFVHQDNPPATAEILSRFLENG